MAPLRNEQVDGKNASRTKKWRRNKNCECLLDTPFWWLKEGPVARVSTAAVLFPPKLSFLFCLGKHWSKNETGKTMHFFDGLEKCNVPEGKGTHCSWNYPPFASLTMTSLAWEIAQCFQASQTQIYFSQIAELEKAAYVPVLLKVGSGCSLL